jgi:hypothetical protein
MSKRSNLISKDVKYVNKDFGEFRQSLIDFSKNYFPDTYNDFNEASPGMMFIELASYVGDVLSFYTDIQLRESLLSTVQEKINLYNIANSLGFKPSLITGASVDLDIYQIVPSTGNGPNNKPDFKYALSIDSNLVAASGENVTFRTMESVDFRYSSSLDPTEISVYSIDNAGEVENYLFRKKVKAVSGTIISRQFSFATPKPYDKITLPENNVLEILSVTDSDGNIVYTSNKRKIIPETTPYTWSYTKTPLPSLGAVLISCHSMLFISIFLSVAAPTITSNKQYVCILIYLTCSLVFPNRRSLF